MVNREPRIPTHSPIVLTARGFGRHFIVKNISRSGAGLEGDKPLRIGEPVTLNYPNGRTHGVVRWARDRFAGVSFHTQLDDDGLASLLGPLNGSFARAA